MSEETKLKIIERLVILGLVATSLVAVLWFLSNLFGWIQ